MWAEDLHHALFGQLLWKDGEARNEGSELVDLNV